MPTSSPRPRANGIPVRRVDEVLEAVGLTRAARRPAGAYSLGMSGRLGVAGALLGDPPVLVLDEPVNGLDPDGVRWIRRLVRDQAAEGRTVFLSSHLMSEMQLTADHLVVIGRGRLLSDTSMTEFLAAASPVSARTLVPDPEERATLVRRLMEIDGVSVETSASGELAVEGRTAAEIGDLAHHCRVRLHQLSDVRVSLEQAYMDLTARSVEYVTGGSTEYVTGGSVEYVTGGSVEYVTGGSTKYATGGSGTDTTGGSGTDTTGGSGTDTTDAAVAPNEGGAQ
ncbi:ABC-type multidrug transport system ATPase subunit [Streptomyces sp. TE33382]